jgi:hypothetical protein
MDSILSELNEKFTNIFWRQEMWQTKNKIKRHSRRKQKKLCTVTHQGVRQCTLTTKITGNGFNTMWTKWKVYKYFLETGNVTNKKQNKKTFKKETKETLYGNTSGVRRCALTTLISLSTTFNYWLIDLFIIN